VNMLRATVACFSAGIGGADAVTVAPFDAALGLPDGFGRRIARNTQSLLLDEARVAEVLDPAGGSWYVERLTADLARTAWAWFQEIERAGGMAAALLGGLIDRRLSDTWSRRRANIAHRRDRIVGVSEFPNLDERRPVRRPFPAVVKADGGLPRHRYGEEFEALRDRADAHEAATGARPRVRLATLGPPPAHSGRVSFALNLFAAGGIECVIGPAESVPAGTELVCLCGNDKAYAESAGSAAAALAGAGVSHVWLAGRPADHPGIESYVHSGSDAVAALTTALRHLGVV
jgi:methylmalonyl-CoA mutase